MTNPYISLLKTAWKYARQEKRQYLLIYFLFLLAGGVFALYPLLYGWFVNALQTKKTGLLGYAWLYAGIYMILKITEWSFHGPARVMERKLAFNLGRNFLHELYHQTLHLPVKWHQDHHSGSTINRIRKAYEALLQFFQNGFMYVYAITKFFSSFIAMVIFSPLFGGIGVALGVFTVWVIFKFDKPFIKAVDETNEKEHVVASTLFDSLSNINTVISLRLEKRMENSLLEKIRKVFPPFMKTVRINEWKWFIADFLVALIYAITVVGYVYQHWGTGRIFMVGNLVALLGFVSQFTSVFHDIAYQYTQIVQFDTNVKTARFIREAFNEKHLPDKPSGFPENWHSIFIKDLNFSYKETFSSKEKAHSLHDIDLVLQKGKRVAFVGESGSGKSTLLALLRGLFDAQPGAIITLDGNMTVDAAGMADLVTLIPQEPEIFENTIEHNITLGLPFENEEILKVCETACFTEVIQQLPNGIQSNIQEKGVNLSGGQKQRLALARGILAAKNSEIILLDEPTSSVDPKTELKIYERLFEEWREKVVVSSLHRLYLLSYFDHVYVLQDGHIVDEGSFEYLKNESPAFQELWVKAG
jgi:ATP-binding cassette, subfamily B, bacterial